MSAIEFQTRKMISSYGGVGSILETIDGAIKIDEIEEWIYFHKELHKDLKNQIEDDRLLRRIRYHFEKLQAIVKIPMNSKNGDFYTIKYSFASGRYFPEWFYCPRCNQFKHLRDWWKGWESELRSTFYIDRIKEKFSPPKCHYCYNKAKNEKKGRRYQDLEQVRFIMTAPTSDIRDIPWDQWITAEVNAKEEDSPTGTVRLQGHCCDNPRLEYFTSTKYSDLSGIRIKCKNCTQSKSKTLTGLFGLRLPVKESQQKTDLYKPVLRSSNSVYYAQIVSGLHIPISMHDITEKDKARIKEFVQSGVSIQQMLNFKSVFEKEYTWSQIDQYLKNEEISVYQTETEFRRDEFNFFQKHQEYQHDNNDLVFEHKILNELQSHFNQLIQIKRLKLITVQTSYTRQEPLDKDAYLLNDEGIVGTEIKRKYTSKEGTNTQYLTGIESYGEGIFLNLSIDSFNKWYEMFHLNFKDRIETLQQNYRNRDMNTNRERFDDPVFTTKFVLVHTLAHVLIKEFEFLVGYPAASLSERLYVDDDNMNGLLIYAIAGSEGSYGGLAYQCTPERIHKILSSAIERARDCASDPVCYHSDGQGVANLNLSACYSCALLPETSCEEFNCFLDRRLLVDADFGFFREITI